MKDERLPLSLISSLTLSNHLFLGLPFFLLLCSSIFINLLPTQCSYLRITYPYHFNLLSCTVFDSFPTFVALFFFFISYPVELCNSTHPSQRSHFSDLSFIFLSLLCHTIVDRLCWTCPFSDRWLDDFDKRKIIFFYYYYVTPLWIYCWSRPFDDCCLLLYRLHRTSPTPSVRRTCTTATRWSATSRHSTPSWCWSLRISQPIWTRHAPTPKVRSKASWQGSYTTWKTWKILQFDNSNARPWIYWNFVMGPGKYRNMRLFLVRCFLPCFICVTPKLWLARK